jgi:hypothetical protein
MIELLRIVLGIGLGIFVDWPGGQLVPRREELAWVAAALGSRSGYATNPRDRCLLTAR